MTISEGTHRFLRKKNLYKISPPRKPPMCAQNAMPVAESENARVAVPLNNCNKNQKPINRNAGICTNKGIIINKGINVTILLPGNINI